MLGGQFLYPASLSLLTVSILCFSSLALKNVEEDHLNDSLGNPGLISPDKEDLSRLLVRKRRFYARLRLFAPGLVSYTHCTHFCSDGAIQRAHPGRHAPREEDHSDGDHRPGAGEVR